MPLSLRNKINIPIGLALAILAIVGGAVGVVVMLFVDGLESYRPIYCGLALSTTLYFGVSFGSPSTRKA